METNMFGEYVRSLGEYPRCRRGCQITPFTGNANEYEGEMTYTGPRLNSAQKVIVDHTVRIAPAPDSDTILFHEPFEGGVVFGGVRVHILFDIDPTVETGPIPVRVLGTTNNLGGITYEVHRFPGGPFTPTLAQVLEKRNGATL